MSERKLATVRTISEVLPIDGADKICAYKIDGWQVVDQINKYQTGDKVIYCEVDSWIPAARFLSKENDGLATDWDGFVWCNPPYGKQTPLWLEKMKQHNNSIALVFSRTDCKWFHDYVATADVVLFLKSRIKFVDWYGETGNSGAGNGNILVGYGDKAKAVMEQCKLNGALYYPEKKG